jgi:hypothetical protein
LKKCADETRWKKCNDKTACGSNIMIKEGGRSVMRKLKVEGI